MVLVRLQFLGLFSFQMALLGLQIGVTHQRPNDVGWSSKHGRLRRRGMVSKERRSSSIVSDTMESKEVGWDKKGMRNYP